MIRTLVLIIISFLFSCKSNQQDNFKNGYLRHVGDSVYDVLTDDDNFTLCHGDDNVLQYFNLGVGPVYISEKPTLVRSFKTKYKSVLDANKNGFIRIRFIVNCEGRAGRFRVLQSDANFNETEFDEQIVSQLTEITKEIGVWAILHDEDNIPVDYYYYLHFKIANGQILEILP